eukprot:PhF_6_TR980/c0_g1_i2/m.1900/K06972/PITRM1, PreP, CYM1; presequence protease
MRRVPFSLVPGTTIEGFKFLKHEPIPDLGIDGYSFEHIKTKAKYYHCAADDTNNVFCVGFCTPNPNSKGLPHILEHTTLCGSDKYPVRDPFFHMLRRSLNTFMNAMTGPDYTMYPFSTVNPVDFNNLLGVYLDAVFHPLLRERDFLQEGHRLELDNNKQLYIKGVVYNEMKGALQNPASYFYSKLCEYALKGTSYAHVLGGCPLHIPDLTHAELVAFQRRHYHPTNATIITYGDLDPVAHMKTIGPVLDNFDVAERVEVPLVQNAEKLEDVIVDYGPPDPMGDPTKSTRVVVSWMVPSQVIQGTPEAILRTTVYLEVLSTLLVSGPASPMYKALIDTHLGSDYSPAIGLESEFRNPLFSFGVQGVDSTKVTAKEIETAINDALQGAMDDGFPFERVDGVIHQALLSKRHRGSQFGLSLALGSVVNAVHTYDVFSFLQTTKILEELREEFKRNGRYFSQIIKSLLMDNKPVVRLVLHADEKHNEKRKQLEDERLKKLQDALTQEQATKILRTNSELEAEQKKPQDVNVLPTLRRSDIAKDIIPEYRGDVVNFGANSLELICRPCNRLVYTNIFVPFNMAAFTKNEALLLPTYCELLCELGAGDYDYEQLTIAKDLVCSGFGCSLNVTTTPDLSELIAGVYISYYALPDRHGEATGLLTKILSRVKFDPSDEKVRTRAHSLVTATAASMVNGVPQRGHTLALTSSASAWSQAVRLVNTLEGLEQVSFLNTTRESITVEGSAGEQALQELLTTLAQIHKKVLSYRAQVWAVCEAESKADVAGRLETMIHECFSREAAVGINKLDSSAIAESVPHEYSFIRTPGEVGFVGAAFRTDIVPTDPSH